MNRIFTLFILTIFCGSIFAQTTIIDENFESYAVGDKIAQTAGANWDTWSSSPGGAEDASISDVQAASGTNSLYITGTNDVVLRLGDQPLTEGRYNIQCKLFIEDANYGYFNVLQEFNGSESLWGTQLYLRPDGSCTIDGGGTGSGSFTQPSGEWFDMSIIIDLDDDFSTLYHVMTEALSYTWSGGVSGGNNTKSLEAMNFYAWAAEGNPGYFVDDILIQSVDKPGSELTVSAELTSDTQVSIEWTGDTLATGYTLVNRGAVISQTTENSHLIVKPYPQLYSFRVGAHYTNQGYRFSNTAELDVVGGKDRDFVVYEVGTGTWCVNCPAAARGVDDMHANGHDVGIIEMHGGDDYENDDSRARIDYYGITGYPTTNFDGMTGIVGGSLNGNLYESFLGLYNNRKSLRSLYSLDMELFDLGEGEYRIAINTEELYEYYDSPVYLRIALTESHIPVTWFNLDEINFVQRQMFPSPTGTLMDYSSGSDTYEHTFTLNPGYVLENCEIVAFLQVDDTKEILNGDVVEMEDALVGVDETLAYDLLIAPNPVSDFVTIKGVENGECSMYSVKGELVRTFIIKSENHVENLQALTAGTYIFSIRTDRGTVSKTVVKQ